MAGLPKARSAALSNYSYGAMTWTKYYFAGTSRIASRTCTGTTCSDPTYYLTDQLGSTSITTNASGAKIAEMRYTAWGEVRYNWGSTPTDYTYTGQYSNIPEFGLMYYNARWYDPYLGRFAQADTIIPLESQGVQAWDRYAGMNNNPVRYMDPSGHDVGCGGRYDGKNCKPIQTVKPKTPAPRPTLSLPVMQSTPVPCQGEPSNACATATAASATAQVTPMLAEPSYSAVPTPNSPVILPSTPNSPHISINIDWDRVDKVDFAIDVIGIVGDVTAATALRFGAVPVAVGAEAVSATVEVMGFAKSGVELLQGNPNSALIDLSESQVRIVMISRFGRVVPGFGIFLNGVSILANLRPEIRMP